MSQFLVYGLAGVGLFCVGLYGVLVRPDLLRKILALNVMGSGVFLFLVAVARRNERGAPDPVPHAMVLTGIVVAVSATALALGILRRMHRDAAGEEVEQERE
jgi:multicomponent Na+:H+ antiporter subunit C